MRLAPYGLMLALVLSGSVCADEKRAVFPEDGTPYPAARAALLKQGLAIVREKQDYGTPQQRTADRSKGIIDFEPVPSVDPKYGEIDCWKFDAPDDPGVKCRALFLETDSRGWQWKVVVPIDPATLNVRDVHYAYPAEGFVAIPIPGPFPKDVPAVRDLTYFEARELLKRLGYRPARNQNSAGAGTVCADDACTRYTRLAETDCSGTGAGFCTAYWLSKDDRVLKVTTIGMYPQVYFAEWSDAKSLADDFGKPRD